MFGDFRFWTAVGALAISTGVYHGSARADVSVVEAEYIVCTLHPDQKALAELQKTIPVFKTVNCLKPVSRNNITADQKNAAKSTTEPVAKSTTEASTRSSSATDSKGGQSTSPQPISFLLRNDWSDLGLLGGGCLGSFGGVSVDKAKGASLSFTNDYVAKNRIWAAQAMAAAAYTDCDLSLTPRSGGGDSGFFEKSVAIYAQVNSSYNSDAKLAKKNNSDSRTAGLSGEAAYLYNGNYHIVRITPNVTRDEIKNTTAGALMAQYIPFWVAVPYVWHSEGILGNIANFQFDPTLDLQYASTTNRSKPLQFSGTDQSLRFGPELTMILAPNADPDTFLGRIGINETFHPWWEVYSHRSSYWWANSIFYNFTDDGNFAIAFSYNRGLDENSGVMTNQYILSLNGKM